MNSFQDRHSTLAGESGLIFQHQLLDSPQNKPPAFCLSLGLLCASPTILPFKTAINRGRLQSVIARHLKIAEEHSAVMIQRVGLGSSFVGLGAGLDVRSLKCGFDTCLIGMKDLPLDVTHVELHTLLSTQGVRSRSYRILGTQQYGDKTLRVSILAEKEAAKKLATKLDGARFRDKVIEFHVAGYNSLSAIQSVMSNILTLSWESPESTSMIAVLSYQDPAVAHAFVEQLIREGLGGHPFELMSYRQRLVRLVKTTKLADGMEGHIFQFY